MNADEILPTHSDEESDFSEDDYSLVDIEEPVDYFAGTDSDLERSLIREEDESTVMGSADEETLSELDQQQQESMTEEDDYTPTPAAATVETGMVPLADFTALQGQVTLLKEILESDRLAYETRLSDLEEAHNNLVQRCKLLETDSQKGFGMQTYVDLLRTRTNNIAERLVPLEERFSTEGGLKELRQYNEELNAKVAAKADLTYLKRILESLSVEQQRLKNIQVAGIQNLERLELQIQSHRFNKDNSEIMEAMLERLEMHEEKFVKLQYSFKRLDSYIMESDKEFNQVSTELDGHLQTLVRMGGEIEKLKCAESTLENVIKSVEKSNNALDNASQVLNISLEKQREILRQEIFSEMYDIYSQFNSEIVRLNSIFEDHLVAVDRKLASQSMPPVKADILGQRDFHELSTRLTISEKAVAQLQKAFLDTIRACKPTVHDCAGVVQQVGELLAWKASVTEDDNACPHCNSREERVEKWITEYKLYDEDWKAQTGDAIRDHFKKIQDVLRDWVATANIQISDLHSQLEKKYSERNEASLGSLDKSLKSVGKALTPFVDQEWPNEKLNRMVEEHFTAVLRAVKDAASKQIGNR